MTAAPIAIAQAIDGVMRNDRGRLIAALIARLRDFQLAEDALQEAAMSAMSHWGRTGLPASPQGWLLRVALRKAIDRLRAGKREAGRVADLTILAEEEAAEMEAADFPDDRLRLIFICCHPALDPKSRVALTLRTIAGLSTPQIAAAFLDQDTTMGQRAPRPARIRSKPPLPPATHRTRRIGHRLPPCMQDFAAMKTALWSG